MDNVTPSKCIYIFVKFKFKLNIDLLKLWNLVRKRQQIKIDHIKWENWIFENIYGEEIQKIYRTNFVLYIIQYGVCNFM